MSDDGWEIVHVQIPIDGPRCDRCGAITVNLNSEIVPCPLHKLCPDCGYSGPDPQPCPRHKKKGPPGSGA